MGRLTKIEETRFAIDDAITAWLQANGLTKDQTMDLDYSNIDEELNYLVENA